jgi:hypothetical protein
MSSSFTRATYHFARPSRGASQRLSSFDISAAATKINPHLCAPMNLSPARRENPLLNLMSDEGDDAHATCRVMFSPP